MEEKDKITTDQVLPEKVYCGECKTETFHLVLKSVAIGSFIPPKSKKGRSNDSREAFIIAQCRGCELITFVKGEARYGSFREAPDLNYENMIYGPEAPPSNEYLDYESLQMIPKSIERLYNELTSNFDNQNQVMAGIALRILVERLCKHQEIPGKNLVKKIDGLVEKGLVTPKAAEALHKLRDIGNAAAHEAKKIKWEYLYRALQVLNACLKSIYVDHQTHKSMVSVKTTKKPKITTNNNPSPGSNP